MIDEREIRRICEDGISNDHPLELIIHRSEEPTELSTQLGELVEHLDGAVEALSVVEGSGADLPARPGLTLCNDERRNIHYLALPEGFETAPFLDALRGLAEPARDEGSAWANKLEGLTRTAELMVFIGPTCPHCPNAVQSAIQLSLASDKVTAIIIDVTRFPALAEQYAVKSVPFTLLDRTLGVTGVVAPGDLVEKLVARGTAEFEALVLDSLLGSSQLAEAIKMVQEAPELFVLLWRRSTMSSRVGLLLIAEEILEADEAALDGLVPELVDVLDLDDVALGGDTADLLGQIGHRDAVPALESLLHNANPDVVEIATDALEMIAERG